MNVSLSNLTSIKRAMMKQVTFLRDPAIPRTDETKGKGKLF